MLECRVEDGMGTKLWRVQVDLGVLPRGGIRRWLRLRRQRRHQLRSSSARRTVFYDRDDSRRRRHQSRSGQMLRRTKLLPLRCAMGSDQFCTIRRSGTSQSKLPVGSVREWLCGKRTGVTYIVVRQAEYSSVEKDSVFWITRAVRHVSPTVNTRLSGRRVLRATHLRTTVMTLAVVVATAGCRHVQLTEPGRVSIRLQNDTVQFRRYENSVAFDITAVIRNDYGKTLFLWECLRSAQKLVDATWQPAWGEACTLGGAAPTQIVPGDSVVRSVTVAGYTDGSAAPSFLFASAVEGTYRVTFPISLSKEVTGRNYLPPGVSSTPPFEVR